MREHTLSCTIARSICPSDVGGRLKTDTASHQGLADTPQELEGEMSTSVLGECHAWQAESADLCQVLCTQCVSSRGEMHHLVQIAHKHHNNRMACSSLWQVSHDPTLLPEVCHDQWQQQNSRFLIVALMCVCMLPQNVSPDKTT